MNSTSTLSKVPAVTLGFWIIKILATTLGETGGDTVSMTMNLGYLVGTAIFLSALAVLVIVQVVAKKFHPLLYWATIIASTTAGTTMAHFADRSLGIGYAGGASVLSACVVACLALWYWSERTISVDTVNTPKGGGVLLVDHHVLANLGHRTRRLGCSRPRRPCGVRWRIGCELYRRRDDLHDGACDCRRGVFLD